MAFVQKNCTKLHTFERLMNEQAMPFAECFLSPLLCALRKGYDTQHALLKFLESCKITIDNTEALLVHYHNGSPPKSSNV